MLTPTEKEYLKELRRAMNEYEMAETAEALLFHLSNAKSICEALRVYRLALLGKADDV